MVVGDDWVEVAAGQGLLDVRLKFIPCGTECDVGLISRAATTSEHGDDTASSIEDDGTRVAFVGEGATPAVGHDGSFEGSKLEIAAVVVTNKGFESVDPADGSARGQAVLDDRHRFVTVDVKLLGLANLALGYKAVDLEEPILRVLVVSPVRVVGVHEVEVFVLLDPVPCVMINELLVKPWTGTAGRGEMGNTPI